MSHVRPETGPPSSAGPMPDAPGAVLDASGRPLLGMYRGAIPEVTWDGVATPHGATWRFLHHKRWHYVSIAGPAVVCAAAVVDLGWSSSAFVYLFDRKRGVVRGDVSVLGLPQVNANVSRRPDGGARTVWGSPRASISLEHADGGAWRLRVRAPSGFMVDAELSGAPPILCAIAPIAGGVANCTHKTTGLLASGTVTCSGTVYDLAGSHAALDHTSGLLSRDTHWKWASAAGAGIGLNLVQGFNGPVENAVWHGSSLEPVGPVTFDHSPARPHKPWRITSPDEAVDLVFTPEAIRRDDRDLGVASSRYVQGIGRFDGMVRTPSGARVAFDGLPGVTEDHQARW